MKICHVVCVAEPYQSGMGNSALQLARGAVRFGHQVFLYTPRYDFTLPDEEYLDGVIIKRLPPLIKYGNAAVLPRLLSELKFYDIVHLHYPFFGSHELVWFAKKILKFNFKLVVHYHMNASRVNLLLKPLLLPSSMIFSNFLNSADVILCSSSDYLKNNIPEKLFSFNKNKIFAIQFGVDTDLFVPETNRKKPAPVLLFVGALDKAHHFKGLDVLFKTMAMLSADISLTIVGGGDREAYYRDAAKKLKIDGRVNFVGRISRKNLIKLYQASTALVLPSVSRQEACGIVLIEAMACGLPVIASDLPGVRTVFCDGEQGLLSKPGDCVDLKAKIENLVHDPEKLRKLSLSARALALKKYAYQNIDNELNNIYLSLR
jgi:glycosyltransferase involved in cell wall biosynthesis